MPQSNRLIPLLAAVAIFTVLLALPQRGNAIPCPYTLPVESNVTVGVYDPQGHLIRTLIKDAHRHGGKNSEDWDGKDQYGAAVPAGDYQIRGIYHPPIDTQYAFTIANPGTPPWPTADGKGDWVSDEASVQAAATDGRNVYLAAPGSEKGCAVIGVGPDGKRIWGSQESVYPRCVSLAVGGQFLYALFSGPELTDNSGRFNGHNAIGRAFVVCLDKETGAPAGFSLKSRDFRIATWPYTDRTSGLWDLRGGQSFTPAKYEGQPRYFGNDVGEPTEAVGIAAAGGKLYVSMFSQNQLLVLDAVTGKQLDTIPAPSPVGLHALADGRILAVSAAPSPIGRNIDGNRGPLTAGKVLSINPITKAVSTLIDRDLDAPHDVTTDAAGLVYVSDWGASFQVKVFGIVDIANNSRTAYHLLRSIGRPGGRPWVGAWGPRGISGMLLPRGIAVTDRGDLWVAEDDAQPSRVSVWNAATGVLERDYIGPAPYGGGGNFWVDPKDPATVMAAGAFFHLDANGKTYSPIATPFRRLGMDEPFTPAGMTGPPGSRTFVHAGKQYVCFSRGEYQMVVMRRDGVRLIPVAAMGCLGRYITNDGSEQQVWDSDIGSHRIAGYYPAYFKGHAGDNFLWIDTNGDGKVEPDEMQWVHTLSRGDAYVPGRQPEACSGWGYGFGPDGAIYFRGFCKDRDIVYRMDVRGWTAGGAPQYDLAGAQPIIVGTASVQSLYVNDANQLLVSRPYEWGPSKDALDCYTRDGKLLWSIARSPGSQGPDDVLADAVLGDYHLPGAGDVLLTWLWHGNYKPYLVTSDGLYITSLLEDTRIGPKADWDESYRQFYQAPDGTPYIINGANDGYHFLTINSLAQARRFATAIHITDAEIKVAAAAPPAVSTPTAQAQPVIHMNWLASAPVVDGDFSDWDLGDAATLRGKNGRSAQAAVARDGTNLYLAFDVKGSKWVNKGGNWQTLFISGDCVDLMLSSRPGKPHYTAAAGDERLLIASFQGGPVAVLYRPVAPGASSPVKLMGTTVDQIVRLNSARIAVKRTADGYTLEAAVPLADLDINLATTETLQGDLGVIYADETGANRSLRLYYQNHNTNMTADLTTEAALQPGEWGPVEFPLGLNLLQNGSFEKPLAATPDEGWAVGGQRSGTATITSDTAYSGTHSLRLEQTEPVVFPPESYNEPDYGHFINEANGGKGGARMEVLQQVPVMGGRRYHFRLHFKLGGAMGGEAKNTGHPRGYDSFQIWLSWIGAPGGEWISNVQSDQLEWRTLLNSRAMYTLLNPPFVAPAGATAVRVSISLVGNAEGFKPTATIDQVELVEAQ